MQHLGLLKTDIARMLIDQLSVLIIICMSLISFRTCICVLFFTFCPLFIIDVIHKNVMPCFQLIDLLDNTYCREVLLIMLKSPFVAWPVESYINGEHGEVKSRGLDLKWSMARSFNACLLLKILITLEIVKVCEITGTT